MIYLLDLLGTLAFAVGGAYKARSRQLNVFGVVFVGAITALGGGTTRDLIIGKTPLFYLGDFNYLLLCLLAGLATYLLPHFFNKTYSVFRFTDSIGLATFVIIGASVCHNHLFGGIAGPTFLSSFACIFMGMLTGFGGGVLRDAIMGDTPYALMKKSNYVSSAFFGAASFYFLSFIAEELGIPVSMAITLSLREIVSPYGFYKLVIVKKYLSRKVATDKI